MDQAAVTGRVDRHWCQLAAQNHRWAAAVVVSQTLGPRWQRAEVLNAALFGLVSGAQAGRSG